MKLVIPTIIAALVLIACAAVASADTTIERTAPCYDPIDVPAGTAEIQYVIVGAGGYGGSGGMGWSDYSSTFYGGGGGGGGGAGQVVTGSFMITSPTTLTVSIADPTNPSATYITWYDTEWHEIDAYAGDSGGTGYDANEFGPGSGASGGWNYGDGGGMGMFGDSWGGGGWGGNGANGYYVEGQTNYGTGGMGGQGGSADSMGGYAGSPPNYGICGYVLITFVAGQAPPSADFSSNATSGRIPFAVQFWDNSTSFSPNSWQWDFGDGSENATTQNPSHVYETSGSYTVTLTANDGENFSSTQKTNYITASIFTNPSFETGDLSGWSHAPTEGVNVWSGSPRSGTYCLCLNTYPASGYISQSVSFFPGTTFSFWAMGVDGSQNAHFMVWIDNMSTKVFDQSLPIDDTYHKYTTSPTQLTGTHTVFFGTTNTFFVLVLDDITANLGPAVEITPAVEVDTAYSYAFNEDAGNATIHLHAYPYYVYAWPLTVHYATGNLTAHAGADYVATSGDIIFQDGENAKDVNIPLLHAAGNTSDRQFQFTLTAVSNCSASGPLNVTIRDVDAGASVQILGGPLTSMISNQNQTMNVKVTYYGGYAGYAWNESSGPVRLHLAGVGDAGLFEVFSEYRLPAGVTLTNGQSYTFPVTLNAPDLPIGTASAIYNLAFQMYWDGYGLVGSPASLPTITVNAPGAPSTYFTTSLNGYNDVAMPITCTDGSSNYPRSWTWYVETAVHSNNYTIVSTAQNTTFMEYYPGVYNVTLTATNSRGSNNYSRTISVPGKTYRDDMDVYHDIHIQYSVFPNWESGCTETNNLMDSRVYNPGPHLGNPPRQDYVTLPFIRQSLDDYLSTSGDWEVNNSAIIPVNGLSRLPGDYGYGFRTSDSHVDPHASVAEIRADPQYMFGGNYTGFSFVAKYWSAGDFDLQTLQQTYSPPLMYAYVMDQSGKQIGLLLDPYNSLGHGATLYKFASFSNASDANEFRVHNSCPSGGHSHPYYYCSPISNIPLSQMQFWNSYQFTVDNAGGVETMNVSINNTMIYQQALPVTLDSSPNNKRPYFHSEGGYFYHTGFDIDNVIWGDDPNDYLFPPDNYSPVVNLTVSYQNTIYTNVSTPIHISIVDDNNWPVDANITLTINGSYINTYDSEFTYYFNTSRLGEYPFIVTANKGSISVDPVLGKIEVIGDLSYVLELNWNNYVTTNEEIDSVITDASSLLATKLVDEAAKKQSDIIVYRQIDLLSSKQSEMYYKMMRSAGYDNPPAYPNVNKVLTDQVKEIIKKASIDPINYMWNEFLVNATKESMYAQPNMVLVTDRVDSEGIRFSNEIRDNHELFLGDEHELSNIFIISAQPITEVRTKYVVMGYSWNEILSSYNNVKNDIIKNWTDYLTGIVVATIVAVGLICLVGIASVVAAPISGGASLPAGAVIDTGLISALIATLTFAISAATILSLTILIVIMNFAPVVSDEIAHQYEVCNDCIVDILEGQSSGQMSLSAQDITVGSTTELRSNYYSFMVAPDGSIVSVTNNYATYTPFYPGEYEVYSYQPSGEKLFGSVAMTSFNVTVPDVIMEVVYNSSGNFAIINASIINNNMGEAYNNLTYIVSIVDDGDNTLKYYDIIDISLEPGESINISKSVPLEIGAYTASETLLYNGIYSLFEENSPISIGNAPLNRVYVRNVTQNGIYSPFENVTISVILESYSDQDVIISIPDYNIIYNAHVNGISNISLILPTLPPESYKIKLYVINNTNTSIIYDAQVVQFLVSAIDEGTITINTSNILYEPNQNIDVEMYLRNMSMSIIDANVSLKVIDPNGNISIVDATFINDVYCANYIPQDNGTYVFTCLVDKPGYRILNDKRYIIVGEMSQLEVNYTNINDSLILSFYANGELTSCNVNITYNNTTESRFVSGGLLFLESNGYISVVADKIMYEPAFIAITQPEASFNVTRLSNDTFSFDASSSYSPESLNIVNYAWDFGDGTNVMGNATTVTHQYSIPGYHTVVLRATDSTNKTGTEISSVNIDPAYMLNAEIVNSTIPEAINVNTPVNVSITVKNTGTISWSDHSGISLYRMNDIRNLSENISPYRVNIAPGNVVNSYDDYIFNFTVMASQEDIYNVTYAMVWYDQEFGQPSINIVNVL